MALGLVAMGLRWSELDAVGTRWDRHAYGSIVWMILGMHVAHLITSTLDNGLLAVLMIRGPVLEKHYVDTTVNAIYWSFVVLVWLPLFCLVFLAPRVL